MRDGIVWAFFTEKWEELKEDWLGLLSEMFERGRQLDQQKHGVIVCIPKTGRPTGPRDYIPITLLTLCVRRPFKIHRAWSFYNLMKIVEYIYSVRTGGLRGRRVYILHVDVKC
jgi:hypothetical protein